MEQNKITIFKLNPTANYSTQKKVPTQTPYIVIYGLKQV